MPVGADRRLRIVAGFVYSFPLVHVNPGDSSQRLERTHGTERAGVQGNGVVVVMNTQQLLNTFAVCVTAKQRRCAEKKKGKKEKRKKEKNIADNQVETHNKTIEQLVLGCWPVECSTTAAGTGREGAKDKRRGLERLVVWE